MSVIATMINWPSMNVTTNLTRIDRQSTTYRSGADFVTHCYSVLSLTSAAATSLPKSSLPEPYINIYDGGMEGGAGVGFLLAGGPVVGSGSLCKVWRRICFSSLNCSSSFSFWNFCKN